MKESKKKLTIKEILQKFQDQLSALVIFAIVFLSYLNTLWNGFVWDDKSFILDAEIIHKSSSIPHFFFGQSLEFIYRPLVYSVFTITYQVFGPNASWFHLLNLITHAGICVLIFIVLRHFISKYLALTLAILFSVHPINVEAVGWISAYSELTYTLYGLLALHFVIKYFSENRKKYLYFSSLLILLSYFSKESAIIFSAVIVSYAFIFEGYRKIQIILSQVAPLAIYLFMRFFLAGGSFAQSYKNSDIPIQTLSLLERIEMVPVTFLSYLKTFLFPFDLRISQYWIVDSLNFQTFYIPMLIILSLSSLIFYLIYKLKKSNSEYLKPLIFFTLWVIFWAGMHMNILPLTMTYADRWFYMAGIGLLAILGIVISHFLHSEKKMKILFGILIVIILIFSALTIKRNFEWKDSLTLYSSDYRNEKYNFSLANNYAVQLLNSGEEDKAFFLLQESIQMNPEWAKNYVNLGIYYELQNDHDQAISSYKKAIKNDSQHIHSYERLANLYLFMSELEESQKIAEDGIEINDKSYKLWRILALSLYGQRMQNKAADAMIEAYMLNPTEEFKELLGNIQGGNPFQIVK